MPIIELSDIYKTYRIGEVETRALDGVSLDFEPGEFSAVVGPSGSGKTTLLQIMGCLDKPDRGVVKLDGRDVTRLNADQRAELRRNVIGFIFQFFALIPVLDAYENVELPLLLAGVGARERRERTLEMLEAVGLSDRIHHRPNQLSGGQQQRVAIARALVKRPLVVLADEPTANLDTANGEQAMEIMQRLNEQTGTAFIFATHDPRVMKFARRTIHLVDGRVAENSAPPQVEAAAGGLFHPREHRG